MWIAALRRGVRLNIWVDDAGTISAASATLEDESPVPEQLVALIKPWLSEGAAVPVVFAGIESGAFAQVPCAVPPLQKISSADARIALHALPCLSQDRPVDMMQGEEAAIAGFLTETPDWDGVLCLPGASTRWAHISAGEVVSFRSFLTGEMFDLLSCRSSLRAVAAGQGWDPAAFDTAVSDALSRPERFASELAQVNASFVLERTGSAVARARLMGWLIGIELAATRPYWLGQNVALIGSGELIKHYATALRAQGVTAPAHAEEDLAVLGLQTAYRKWRHAG
jgi:2-dehydro-3-deoxygalactonokinase